MLLITTLNYEYFPGAALFIVVNLSNFRRLHKHQKVTKCCNFQLQGGGLRGKKNTWNS